MPIVIGFILIVLLLGGCISDGQAEPIDPIVREPLPPTLTSVMPVPVDTGTHTPTIPPAMTQESPTASATIRPIQTPRPTLSPFASMTPTADRAFMVAFELAQAVPPPRDDVRLAAAFKGFDSSTLSTQVPEVTQPLIPGTHQTFKVLDVVNTTFGEIEAELLAVGDHAYFWFETEPFGLIPDDGELSSVVSAFDDIYPVVTGVFGQENSPGIDGDRRLHVLHASPQTICGVSPDGEGGCSTAGFVSSADLIPAVLNAHSNEREMFVMNDRQFGGDYYLGVLAHELRHMIEFNYDLSDTDWEKEGSSVLATQLVGLPSSSIVRANAFLANPDQQLNSWTETNKGPYYGQGYLFNQYIYNRLGETLYGEFARSPFPGLVAIDRLGIEHGLDLLGDHLWLDWLAALVLHDYPQTPEKYRIDGDGLESAALFSIPGPNFEWAEDVRQYAADYYELPLETVSIKFTGADTVPILAGQEVTDETFWYAQRANYSNPRLTRTVDLREATAATLTYDVYSDIELGYDFAYASVSLDGGKAWEPLSATNMQGLDPADDPSGSALAPRFYTGRTQEWRHEIVDLTPYAGQEILLRYEMVTDPTLTYSGLAVDNIAIPEIGYFDEGDGEGWSAEGFTLTNATLPQTWHLQLITFPGGKPQVEVMPVSPGGQATFEVSGETGQRRPILIIAASAPMTLEPATYTLEISD